MVQHHFNDHANIALMGGIEECLEIVEVAVGGIYRAVVRNVVTIVSHGGRKKRHEPNRIDTKFLEVVQFLGQTAEVSIAVASAVVKSPHVDLIDDCVLVPKRVLSSQRSFLGCACVARTLM